MYRADRILRQRDLARKQLALLRWRQQVAFGALVDASEWQGAINPRAFRRARLLQFENYMKARAQAKAAGSAIFG